MEGSDCQAGPPADWYEDPSGRHQFRYWDGTAWTDHVSDSGQQSADPLTASGGAGSSRPSARLEEIGTAATSGQWFDASRGEHMLKPVKDTWEVDCRLVGLSEEHVRVIEQLRPLDEAFTQVSGRYQYQLSSNSIFVHPHGAWTNFGYLKFRYHDDVYYVNVPPMGVDLTQELYARTDDLSHMSKIMITLGEFGRTDRERFMILMEGDLTQNE